MRILIVDDDAQARNDYRCSFAFTDLPVTCHAHGPAVFDAVTKALSNDQPFSVAFVDVAGDGVGTLRRLRALDPDINLVVVTADPAFSAMTIGGPVDKLFHIAKPFTAAEVTQMATALRERWSIDRQLIAARAQLRIQVLLLEERRLELAAAEARAVHLALHDSLTEAPNRLAFLRALEVRVKRPGSFATAMLDLDRFKLVNDTLGHLAGDALIRAIFAILRSNAPADALIARLGGDEFGILFDTDGEDAAVAACRRLVGACGVPIAVMGNTVLGGASAGTVVVEGGRGDATDVIRRADLALNEAKRRGRGGVWVFDAVLDEGLQFRRRIERDLAYALENDELALAFQPIVAGDGIGIEGFEALLRWDSPDHGAVSPDVFLPVAEESNIIHALGDWVLTRALEQVARWPGHYLSINVSPRQFRLHDFAGHVAACLAGAGVAATQLQIEISERALAEDPDRAAETLRRLRAIGCRVALDDFGMGHTSLGSLRDLSLDALKLHRSFVAGIGCDPKATGMVRALVQIGRTLELDVVAKGAETAAQVQALRIAGVSHLQGFHIARPLDGEGACAMAWEAVEMPLRTGTAG